MEALRTNTRISLSNILVTTDFSQSQRPPCRTRPLYQYEAKIVVAHALGTRSYLAGVPPPVESAQGQRFQFLRPTRIRPPETWHSLRPLDRKQAVPFLREESERRRANKLAG